MIKTRSGVIKTIAEKFIFPNGELHLSLNLDFNGGVVFNPYRSYGVRESIAIDVSFDYENDAEIFELLLTCENIKHRGHVLNTLYLGYVPYSRQDRRMTENEPLSIKVFADLINSLNFKEVIIIDAHSQVTTALINNCTEIEQCDSQVLQELLRSYDEKIFYLISPDGGALKKTYKIASMCNSSGVIECSKQRNLKTGEITGTIVHCQDFMNADCIIVDDICDGGRTFIEIAKILHQRNCGKIILYVTHGFFTKGLEVFDGLIDQIFTTKGEENI